MLQPQDAGLAKKTLIGLLCILLNACGGGSGTSTSSSNTGQKPDPVTVDLPIAYIKRPIPVDKNNNPVFPDLLDPTAFNGGAAIYIKDRATALATPVNITDAAFDAGAVYDVKDLSVSPDGKKLLFAMHAPMLKNVTPDKQPKWHIWEYSLTTKVLRPIISSNIVAEQGHDLSPRYLPDGRILFSSTRQIRSKAILLDDGKPQYSALEEGGDDPAFVLHTMKDDGTDIQQITYNQSHDLQPTVLQNGKVLYTRWDQFAHNNLSFYTVNPDGTQVERNYGFFSLNVAPANMNDPRTRLFRPQEMLDGRIAAILKPDGALLGGDMVVVDTKHFFENDLQIPAGGGTGATAQASISTLPINIKVGATEFSEHGRYSALTPLYDGTNRLLVSWSECRLIEPTNNKLVPCTPTNLATAGVKEAPPLYGIWVYNIDQQTQQPVVLAEEGTLFTEPVSLEPRVAPAYLPPETDATLAAESVGMIHIRSVYDMDGTFNNYGATAFTSLDQIIQTAPDLRPARFVRLIKPVSIPDDETANNLGDNTYGNLFRNLGGNREILGYAPVEPDGSVKIKVPADVAFTLEVLNKDGKRIGALHRIWLQVRPGEVRECNGCHNAVTVNSGHGRTDAEAASINKGAATASQFPNTVRFDKLATPVTPTVGETMAEFATHSTWCLVPGDASTCAAFSNKAASTNLRAPSVDLVFDDEWTDPAVRAKTPSFAYRYKDLAPNKPDIHSPTSEACMEPDGWSSLCRVVINYENHIQPIWERTRTLPTGDSSCLACHTTTDANGNANAKVPDGQLDLNRTKAAANEEMLSYTELTSTTDKQILDENGNLTTQIPVCELAPADLYPDIPDCTITLDINGKPTCDGVAACQFEQDPNTNAVILDANGNPIPLRRTVGVGASMSRGSARASTRFFNKFATFDATKETVDHRGYLNNSELKLLAEWLDIGGRYFNNPFDTIAQ